MSRTISLAGGPVARALAADIEQKVAGLARRGVVPGLGILQIGEEPDDLVYERMALKKCGQFGLNARVETVPADCAFGEFRRRFDDLNGDPSVDGLLILGKFPGREHRDYVQRTIRHRKDVDAVGYESIALLYSSAPGVWIPCTAEAVLRLLDHYGLDVSGKKVCVVGRSLVIGRPLALALVNRNATVKVCHSATGDLRQETLWADYIFTAMGRAKALDRSYIGENTYVIDVGINYDEQGSMCGDADSNALQDWCAGVTPVPGGVGAITNTVLIQHIVASAMDRDSLFN